MLETLHILDMRQGLAAESKEAFACGSTGGKQNHLPGIVEQVPPQAAAPASVGQIQAKGSAHHFSSGKLFRLRPFPCPLTYLGSPSEDDKFSKQL